MRGDLSFARDLDKNRYCSNVNGTDPYKPWWKVRNYDDVLKNRVAMGLLVLLAPEVILIEVFWGLGPQLRGFDESQG